MRYTRERDRIRHVKSHHPEHTDPDTLYDETHDYAEIKHLEKKGVCMPLLRENLPS